ncbi:MAG: glutamine--fructose-6-phosphate transaminase (isomerizing) [Candidatus Bathyarchaeia archaeon]
MCGIFGCLLRDGRAATIIHPALRRLEYRGYDSVGESTIHQKSLHTKKDAGRIQDVHSELNLDDLPGSVGIGHCRWATHGAPYKENAHPHHDCKDQIAVVHNGIIENFLELKKELIDQGHVFRSKTDTEVIPHLIERSLDEGKGFVEAVREATGLLDGSYAIAVLYANEPRKIVCARRESPLVLGASEDGLYCASDIPAFLPLTKRVVVLNDGELAVLTDEGYIIRRVEDWAEVVREPTIVDWTAEMAEKQGYPHFMLKEIYEQPRCLRDTLRLQESYLDLMATFLDRARDLFLVAAGTSLHACQAASYMFSELASKPSQPVVASEFIAQYGKAVGVDTAVLAVSQSGETADTISAVMYARNRAATILGLTNVVASTLSRISRAYVCQQSGPEIGVAATKTFTSQLSVLTQLAIRLAKKRGKIGHKEAEELEESLEKVPDIVEEILKKQEKGVARLAKRYLSSPYFLFLARGMSTAVAAEGRLKLLEISYIPSFSYPAGESKHGPISLIEKGIPVIFVSPNDPTRKTLIGNVMEMKARGARVISLIEEGDEEIKELSDDFIEIPSGIPSILTPIPYVIPLQMFAYYTGVGRGIDVDHPRGLAKSVTVR